MTAQTQQLAETAAPAPLLRSIGLTGRVAVTWTMAGGLLLGGVLVALMTLSGRLSGHGIFMTASGLFLIGALLGALHGVVLGVLGRPTGTDRREALHCLARGALYVVPALALSWLLTVWVAMSFAAAYLDRLGPTALVVVAWVGSAAVVGWAAVHGLRALQNAYARWPQRRLGTILVATVFAALLVTFLADRPEIWLVRLRVTEVGAVLLAAFLSLWVAGPLVTVALKLVRDLPGHERLVARPRNVPVDVGLGLLAGAVVGLVALPFTPAADVMTGAAGGAVVAVAQAVVDEILLRLVLLTGVAWLVLRWGRVHKEEAAILAVASVAVAQILLYLPGVLAAGFPTALAAVSFTGAAILLPAVVFGAVYWTRGLTAAMTADATAALALLLLV